MKKRVICVLLALAMVIPFAACSSSSSSSAVEDGLKIGAIGPYTGAAAIYGVATKNGAEMAVEEINAKESNQLKLTFKAEDDEHDPEKSVNAYNALKDWGMQVLVGTTTTSPSIAVAPEANKDGIFMLTPSASSVDVIKDKDNVFQMCFTDPNQGTASAEYIASKALGTKIAVIYNNADAYSKGIFDKFMAEAEVKGLNVVSTTTFTDDTANDFSVQLKDAQAKGADLIFLPIYYTPASLILTQANGMGYAPKFFGVDGMDGILTLEGFDTKLAEGVMLLTPFSADAQDDLTKNFVANYKEKYGEVPNQFAADAYDCVYAIYAAAVKAGVTKDMSAQEINDALVKTFTAADFTFTGLTGENMTWAKTGEVTKPPKGMIIKDGAYVGMD